MDFEKMQPVCYAGPGSDDPLSFRWYDPDHEVEGRSMREHLRFASCFWHTMRNGLADPFGRPTAHMPWDDGTDSIENATRRVDVFFSLLGVLGIEWYCFHDHDVAPEGVTSAESADNLARLTDVMAQRQEASGIGLLWGTACLFAHPRYAHGAATSPDVEVFARAAGQIRRAIDATHALGGAGYVFWGGREGYTTLLNTDLAHDRARLADMLHMAVAYKRAIGFDGRFYIEPKPHEPTAHQYDSDVEACLNFLREFDLLEHFSLNIETNHATLAGHSMEHELRTAAAAGALGSVDANMGDPHLGWDTDRFPTDLALTTRMMLAVLDAGGLGTGGINFDAKRRRESMEPIDLVHAHVAGMDAMAFGLRAAAAIRADGRIGAFTEERYASWSSDMGRRIVSGDCTLEQLDAHARTAPEPEARSGRQEYLERIVNDVMTGVTA